jgi:acyl-CoA thioesterase
MDFERLKEIRNQGFIRELGFQLTDIREGYAKGELILKPTHQNPIGSAHGGVIYSIADTVGGAAATSYGRYVTTVTGNINYLRPAMNCEKLIGESREIKVGKKICVYEVTITNEKGSEIAVATMTFFYLDKKGKVE